MESNHRTYDYVKSFERIENIITESENSFEERSEIPPRDQLTFTNGFYVNCSALFVDIRGSSDLPSKHTRPKLSKLYRSYISEVVAVMNGNSNCAEVGIEGDCVWGIFNTPKKIDVDSMFITSAKISSVIDVMNFKFSKRNIQPIKVGIGLHPATFSKTSSRELTPNSNKTFRAQYQSGFRGFAQYYLLAYNAHQLHGLKRTMELSLARTLANKYKTTVNKIFKKYRTTRETDGQSYKVLQTEVEREGKKPLVAYFGGFKLGFKKDAVIEDTLPTGKVYSIKSQLIDRLLKDTCELCESRGNIEMHHVKKLKDLENNGRKEKPEWMKRMIAMRRKTLAVCHECHLNIHSGKYNGKRVTSANVD